MRRVGARCIAQARRPFTSPSDPADAILIATEDGWEDTIRPRLEVASADLHRVHVLCANDDGTGTPPSLMTCQHCGAWESRRAS